MANSANARFVSLDWSSVTAASRLEFNDQSLVQAAQRGDRAAFGELYRRYARMVHGVLLARVPPGAAEDLVQDVFLHVLPRLHALRDVSRFGPWLAAIARNRATDFHRSTKPESSLDDHPAALAAMEAPRASLAVEDGMALLDAVRQLPEAFRELLILRFVEGMSGPEIAARTGLTHGSVRVNLHRGMQLLREKWDAQQRLPGIEKRS
jgi:RNA polymerase sigma-70 factor, ECF subfamily